MYLPVGEWIDPTRDLGTSAHGVVVLMISCDAVLNPSVSIQVAA